MILLIAALAQSPLTGLPSAPTAHVEKIKALGDDAWLNLGAPVADPKWGKARGRSWTPKMPFATDLRVAFLFGSGQHGYVKPDGHYQDDLWAYDVNQHRWICVYPGSDAKTLALKRDARGFEVNEKGEPIPVASIGHGYGNETYIPGLKKFMFVTSDDPYWTNAIPQRKSWLAPGASNYNANGNPKHPWYYDVATGKWDRHFIDGPGPDSRCESILEWIPTRRQAFFLYHGGKVFFYDPVAKTCVDAGAKGPKPPFGIDPVSCYDAKRDRVYVQRDSKLWGYDVKTNTSFIAEPKGMIPKGEQGGGRDNTMTYDSVNDVVVLNVFRDAPEQKGIYVYAPDANTWTRQPSAFPKDIDSRRNVNGFYDPQLNAHFFHGAGDSDDNGLVWVYRYKKK